MVRDTLLNSQVVGSKQGLQDCLFGVEPSGWILKLKVPG